MSTIVLGLPFSLSPRRFAVQEAMSGLFSIAVWATSEDESLPAVEVVGKPASFQIESGYVHVGSGGNRLWKGICAEFEQVRAVNPQPGEMPLHTYVTHIVPPLWLLTQRKNYRIFQHKAVPDIVEELLGEWHIEAEWKIDRAAYPKLEYKVQYGESDFAFLSRLIEEVGISFSHLDPHGAGSKLTFGDAFEKGTSRPPLAFTDNPNASSELASIQNVRLSHEVRPGAFTIRDYDFRKPSFELLGEAPKVHGAEARYEQYHFGPGAFLVEGGKGGDTPVADDKGVARHDQAHGKNRAHRMLDAQRMGSMTVSFETNVMDVCPGVVFSMLGHHHGDLGTGKRLLVTEFSIEGTHGGEWSMSGRAVFADAPFRPRVHTPKPKAYGVQSATVVGPSKQEIHTDEFGRVRVQFPWDREGKNDDGSSCWIRVSQGWAGTGYGMMALPRIGQEVLVGFLDGDPEQPIVVGRVYNRTQPVPHKLPDHKTVSTWKSDSSAGSSGFNEIKFEDKKGDELFYEQAEKNRRVLIKHNETITVLRHREKHVGSNETDTTGVNRFEVTGVNRSETTNGNRMTLIGGTRRKLVKKNETERTEGNRLLWVTKDQDLLLGKKKRELIEEDSHLEVRGNRSERIDGNQSTMVIENRQERVEKRYALKTGKELYLRAGEVIVGEAGADVTIKGPGGFLRIDAAGVTIKGTMVYINEGGVRAGKGTGPKTEEVEEMEEEEEEVLVPLAIDLPEPFADAGGKKKLPILKACAGLGLDSQANVDAYVKEMKALQKNWQKLSLDQRRAALKNAANHQLEKSGVPSVGVRSKDLGHPNGHLAFQQWELVINEKKLKAKKLTDTEFKDLANTVYHESRHAEQWYLMAQKQASDGKTAAQIRDGMDIPSKVAKAAAAAPLPKESKRKKCASVVNDSVYGKNRDHRSKTLTDLPKTRAANETAANKYRALAADPKATADAKAKALKEWQNAYAAYQKVYSAYRKLPEETDAWSVGGKIESAW